MASHRHFQESKRPDAFRIHEFSDGQKRIEVGFRIPPDMGKRILDALTEKQSRKEAKRAIKRSATAA